MRRPGRDSYSCVPEPSRRTRSAFFQMILTIFGILAYTEMYINMNLTDRFDRAATRAS
jgi:hypothetical protein